MYCSVSAGDILMCGTRYSSSSLRVSFSMTPHRRQVQCCAMRGLHTIVSYHCIHCTDVWDWIGSQGLLFRDPTSSHAGAAGQLDPCEVMIVSLQLKMSTATLSPDSNCSDSDKQFWNFGNSRLNDSWLLTLHTFIECNAFRSLHLGRIIKLIRRWNALQFTRSAQARCRSEVIAKCTKYKDNTQTKYIKVIRLWNTLQHSAALRSLQDSAENLFARPRS